MGGGGTGLSLNGGGGATDNYWHIWSSDFGGQEAKGVGVDSQGYIYVTIKDGNTSNPIIIKYDPDGIVQWQKVYSHSNSDNIYDLEVDSNDDVVVAVKSYFNGVGRYGVFKVNSSGVLQWSKQVYHGSGDGPNDAPGLMFIDSSDNIYINGYSNKDTGGGSTYQYFMTRFNSSGTLTLNRHLRRSSGYNIYGTDVVADNSGNIYIAGYGRISSNYNKVGIGKYNSSGTLQWVRSIGNSNHNYGGILATDGTNIFVFAKDGTTNFFEIHKINSSGSSLWKRKLGNGTNDCSVTEMTCDSSGNLYVAGYVNGGFAGGTDGFVAKYDNSGNIQWQKYLGSRDGDYPFFRSTHAGSSLYLAGRFGSYSYGGSGSDYLAVTKLPDDGSLSGYTYGSLSYGDTTLTDSAGSMSLNPVSLTSENESHGTYNGARTTSNVSKSYNVVAMTGGVATGYGSVSFDGTGDCLTIADTSDLEFGSDDFTIEAFIKYTGNPGTGNSTYAIFSKWDNQGAPADKGFILRISDDGGGDNLQWFYTTNGSTNKITTGNTVLSPNTWYHIAFVRNGSTGKFYIDGTQDSATVSFGSDSIKDTGNNFRIGANLDVGSINQEFNGLISNVRVTRQTALYTSNFTAPTSPLTAVGTVGKAKLLCCQSSVSATAGLPPNPWMSITANGNVAASSSNPFS